MRTLVFSAGKRIGDESAVKKWIEFAVDRVVQKPIANGCFMDISGFGIGDIESLISPMLICSIG